MDRSEKERLAYADYWDERYSEVGPDQQYHEWFRSFEDLLPFFQQNILTRPGSEVKVLHLGSGDSTVPDRLAERGYNDQLCLDFSSIVIDMMSKRHAAFEGIEWRKGDVRDMDTIATGSVDIAFDKGTLDAMVHGSPWFPPDDVLDNTGRYIREVFRVLKPDGMFVYVTYKRPQFVKPLLECEGTAWDVKAEVLGGEGSFGYHGFTLTKGSSACKETMATPEPQETKTSQAPPVGNEAVRA